MFGGKILTYGGMAGLHSNEIHRVELTKPNTTKKPKVDITTIRSGRGDVEIGQTLVQSGDVPPPLTGHSLTKVSPGIEF